MSAAKWAEFPLLAYDIETTGVDVFNDRIVQAALVTIKPDVRPESFQWLVDPGVTIPDEAAAVHGISTERARAEGGDPAQMLFELVGKIALWVGHGFPLVVMNAPFDLTMLEAECARHGIEGLEDRLGLGKVGPVLDPFVLDKHADTYRRGGRRLENLCATYGVTHTGAHDAAADALAAGRLFPKIMAKHARKFPGHTLGSLHESQIGWRKAQQDGLRAYFDKQGTVHDGCCPEWPLHKACVAERVAS